jgi:hypothetical protein
LSRIVASALTPFTAVFVPLTETLEKLTCFQAVSDLREKTWADLDHARADCSEVEAAAESLPGMGWGSSRPS